MYTCLFNIPSREFVTKEIRLIERGWTQKALYEMLRSLGFFLCVIKHS